MKRSYQRFEQDSLKTVVATSISFAEVCRKLNRTPVGGNITNIQLMCKRWDIDTSHMTGQAHSKGKKSSKRLSPELRLTCGTSSGHRTAAHKLRTALEELGVEIKCVRCNNPGTWNGKPLVLEIDHIDGQYWNNVKENLQFLCPNCHAQKTKEESAPVDK